MKVDQKYTSMALEYARRGRGFTYPNPVVGCVLVRSKKGNPEGEGVVIDGVEAATSVLPNTKNLNTSSIFVKQLIKNKDS